MLLALLACDHPAQTSPGTAPAEDPEVWAGPPLERQPEVAHFLEDTGFPYDALVSEHEWIGFTSKWIAANGDRVVAPMDHGVHEWVGPVEGVEVMASGATRSMTYPDGTAWDEIPGFRGSAWGGGLALSAGWEDLHGYDEDWQEVFHLVTSGETAGIAQITSADLTNDGVEDVVWTAMDCQTSNWWGTVSILDGTSTGTLTSTDLTATLYPDERYTNEGFGCGVVPADDVDGDGVDDLIVDGGIGFLFLGPITGSLTSADADVRIWSGLEYAPVSDVDGDGRSDVVITDLHGASILSIRQRGDLGPEDAMSSYNCLGETNGLRVTALDDIDGDSRVELSIVVDDYDGEGLVWVVPAEEEGAYACSDTGGFLYERGFWTRSVDVTDLDSDGEVELAITVGFHQLDAYGGILFVPHTDLRPPE